ncbi:hypothetical protein [Anabaena azotica]|uniref:Uncharacterized protein n=1 Tax=Anabaena azotica FACHB-119 TaxID=947527 RepID=A0ABR8DFC9_9NOST|nr:hypothetical protein [Anabaena azotica]MBD2505228.1 hypothetical protein [Anabaena azotica FACHB-119]
MKNQENPTQLFSCKLSGVVTVPDNHSLSAVAWKKKLISSFPQPRFKDVLTRATVLPRVSWFWHSCEMMQICQQAIAIIALDTHDYRKILIECDELAIRLQNLDPSAALLLMVSPGQDFAFGIDLTTGEMFSTHILLTQKQRPSTPGLQKQLALNNCVPLPVPKVVSNIEWNGRKIC